MLGNGLDAFAARILLAEDAQRTIDANEDVNFGDMDVLAAGPVATEVGGQFDRYWNNALAYPIASLARDSRDLDELRRDLEKYGRAQRGSPNAERVADSDLVRKIEDGRLDFKWGRALVFYDLPEKLVTDPDDRSTHMGPELRQAEHRDRHPVQDRAAGEVRRRRVRCQRREGSVPA